jgi:CHASE2 domain-containing sensor protein
MAKVLLEIWQVGPSCLVKLSWGQGQSLDARVEYPQAFADACLAGLPLEKQWLLFREWWLDGKLHHLREALWGLLRNKRKRIYCQELCVKYQDDPTISLPTGFSLVQLPWQKELSRPMGQRLTIINGNQSRLLPQRINRSEFLLEVWQFGTTCLFKLSWDKNLGVEARVPYSKELMGTYDKWAASYRGYYGRSGNRAPRAGATGAVSQIADDVLENQLTIAEKALRQAFSRLWEEAALEEIRQALKLAHSNEAINLLVQCGNRSLARLPWELLEKKLQSGVGNQVSVLRTINQRLAPQKRINRPRLRILAIFAGDDNYLKFSDEQKTLQEQLTPIADVQFAGYKITPAESNNDLKKELNKLIDDRNGWDILFFAGHSHEQDGSELTLAPGYPATIEDFEPALRRARSRGLQFALFNSCQGSLIAEKLMSYGLNHVAVMREPVTNEVAYAFFKAFSTQLIQFCDVQTAVIRARESLWKGAKEEFQYPSAYLVPTIYAYPGVRPLSLSPLNWRVLLYRLRPTRREVIVLLVLGMLSLNLQFQHGLIDRRQTVQSIYRSGINSILQVKKQPSILVVELNKASLDKAENQRQALVQREPIDRPYLAQLVRKASDLGVKTVGVDYALVDQEPGREVLRQAIEQSHSKMVFAASDYWKQDANPNDQTVPAVGRITGDIGLSATFDRSKEPLFFARSIGDPSALKESIYPFAYQLWCVAERRVPNCSVPTPWAYFHPVTQISEWFGQKWLNPWVDYSYEPEEVYHLVWSQDFLERQKTTEKIVILAPSDEFDAWVVPSVLPEERGKISGGKVHAYFLDNLLSQHLVVPIPDLWMLGLVAGVGKFLSLRWQSRSSDKGFSRRSWFIWLVVGPIMAYLASLQIYMIGGIVIPILIPMLAYLNYLLPQSRYLRGWMGKLI